MNTNYRRTHSPLAWLAVAMLVFSGSLPAQVIPGRYIAVLKQDTRDTPGAAKALAAQHNLDVDYVYTRAIKGFAFNGSEQAAQALAHRAEVAYVEPDQIYTAFQQTVPTGIRRSAAAAVPGLIGSGLTVDADVAVIDTGLDGTHPDLNVMPGGVRFYQLNANKMKSDSNWQDDHGHGTHVGGTIGALDNDIGVVGVAPGVRLTAVKVLDSSGRGSLSVILAGVDWVAQRADTFEVANMSLGGRYSQAMNDAVKAGTQAGVVFVVAAGNSAYPAAWYSPASEPTALTVSALADTDGLPAGFGPMATTWDADETLAYFSNFGEIVDVCAPGVDIYSTYLMSKGGYTTMSGTSMAAPHAAGAAALYIARQGLTKTAEGVEAVCAAIRDAGWQPRHYACFYDFIWYECRFDDFAEPLLNVPNLLYSNEAATVSLVTPADARKVTGTVTVQATTTASSATAMQFYLDGLMIGEDADGSDGWALNWDTTLNADGVRTLVAVATEGTAQLAGKARLVGVNNQGTLRPSVRMLEPYFDPDPWWYPIIVSNVTEVAVSVLSLGPVATVELVYGNALLGQATPSDGNWVFTWDTTQSPDGEAMLMAVATDTDGAQAMSLEGPVLVTNNIVIPDPSIHLGYLEWGRSTSGGTWTAKVRVTIHDVVHAPVAGATVHGTWDGVAATPLVTDETGRCIFSTDLPKNVKNVTFTLTDVVPPPEPPGVIYDPSLNHDYTSVTIWKP